MRFNNIDIFRLIAACIVVLSHQFGFDKHKDPLYSFLGKYTMGEIGVFVFFLISGFLISKSLSRNNQPIHFLWNRFLRIYPGLIVCIFICALLIGPLYTNLTISEYFTHTLTYSYFFNLSLIKLSYYLPGVFENDTGQFIVNAPIWTLFFEVLMYFIALGFSYFNPIGNRFSNLIILLFVLVSICISSIGVPPELFVLKINAKSFLQFFSYFFVGYLIFRINLNIVFKHHFILFFMLVIFVSANSYFHFVSWLIFITYVVVSLGFSRNQIGSFITNKGDYSYGIYIYGFVVQNMVNEMVPSNTAFILKLSIVFLLTFLFAIFSWHIIERPSLLLKSSGKGFRKIQ
jgi:peptidoglycan/LPS O-acetylase OafA/YrhL